jgi:hypothetical protein
VSKLKLMSKVATEAYDKERSLGGTPEAACYCG